MTPPRITPASGSHPSSSPATRPGTKLATKSTPATGRVARSPAVSSSGEYSIPSINSSSTTPISAPTSMKSSAVITG